MCKRLSRCECVTITFCAPETGHCKLTILRSNFFKKRFCAVGRREGSWLAVAHLQVRLWAVLTAAKKCQRTLISEDSEIHNLREDPPQLQACSLQNSTDPMALWPSPEQGRTKKLTSGGLPAPRERLTGVQAPPWGGGKGRAQGSGVHCVQVSRASPSRGHFLPGAGLSFHDRGHWESSHWMDILLRPVSCCAKLAWANGEMRVLHTQFPWVWGSGGFLTPRNNSQAPEALAGCPKIHLSSDTVYPEITFDFTVQGSVLQDWPPPHFRGQS